MQHLPAMVKDWLRERRIRQHFKTTEHLFKCGRLDEARREMHSAYHEINSRSDRMQARLLRTKGVV